MKITENFENRANYIIRKVWNVLVASILLILITVGLYFGFEVESWFLIIPTFALAIFAILHAVVAIILMLILHFGKYPEYEVECRAGLSSVTVKRRTFTSKQDAKAFEAKWEAQGCDFTALTFTRWV